jgi:cytoskeletal protein RodZ
MESIGQRLRLGRERLGLSLEEVERTIRIRTQHLASLERDDFDSLPSPVQARGFLKNYSDFLKLDTARVLQDYTGARQSRPSNGGRPAALGCGCAAEVGCRPTCW